jgi:hypothetical protein
MQRYPLAMFVFCLAINASAKVLNDVTNPELRTELLKMQETDQNVRNGGTNVDLEKVDALHRERLKKIVQQSGWPKISDVGRDGAFAAWLIAQHADNDPAFQQHVLELLEPLVQIGEAAPQSLAYLHDRTHQPQKYGTQGSCDADGEWPPAKSKTALAWTTGVNRSVCRRWKSMYAKSLTSSVQGNSRSGTPIFNDRDNYSRAFLI